MRAADVQKTVDLLNEIKPIQIYFAGDFANSYGTLKV